MEIQVPHQPKVKHTLSSHLFGFNIATFNLPVMGMLSDRLINPKFTGHEDTRFGTAQGWTGDVFHCRLLSGMGMSHGNAQLVQKKGGAIGQYGFRVYTGEKITIEFWAKARHNPANIEVTVKPTSTRQPPFATAKTEVNSAHWKLYSLTFDMPVTELNTGLSLTLLDDSVVLIDQIHLRPAEQPHLDTAAIEAVRSFSPSVLRFGPPGIQNGTGPIHLRADGCDFGIDEFLELCADLEITPQILVDIAETPELAAEQAGYCRLFFENRGLIPPHIFFQMGNEQYAAHELSHMTGEMYVETLRDFVPAVKAEYPDSSIIAIGYPCSGAYGTRGNTPWRELVLDQASGLVDMISNHYYKGQWQETFEEQRRNMVESISKIRDDIMKMIDDIRARKLDTRIAVTEWNYWLHANNGICCTCKRPLDAVDEPMDSHHSLFVAGMIHMLSELGHCVEISNYYQLINGLSVLTNYAGYYHETPVADIFRLYRPAFPGKYVEVVKKDLRPDESTGLETMCVGTNEGVFLFIINHACATETEVTLPEIFSSSATDMLVFEGCKNGVEDFPVQKTMNERQFTMPPSSVCRCFAETKSQVDNLHG